jgi:hypothetical protein
LSFCGRSSEAAVGRGLAHKTSTARCALFV